VALSADQQAMLQLLLERGQGYADLASLLGVDEAEVRARARATLTELAGADPDRQVGLTDYLLGQADPIGRADAVRHLKDDPADLELATEITQKIRLIAPNAELPRLPGEERRPRPARARGPAASRPSMPGRLRAPSSTLSSRQTRLAVGVGSAVLLVVMIVLAFTGAFSGGDDDTATSATTNGTTTAAGSGPLGFPLTQVRIDESGDFQNSFAIPQGYQALLPQTQAIYVTLAKAKKVLRGIQTALDTSQPLRVEGKTAFAGIVNSAGAQRNVIPIPLQPGEGVKGSGDAALALPTGNEPLFQLKLTGVEQPPKGSAYIVWFVLATA
jgi:hypothetical protein